MNAADTGSVLGPPPRAEGPLNHLERLPELNALLKAASVGDDST